MKDISRLKTEDFETLLGWLSADREKAGAEYNKIREGLIRFFRFKGCSDAHTLADETLNRVAEKVLVFDESKNVKKISIVYGFASKIFLEYLRAEKRQMEGKNKLLAAQRKFAETDSEPDDSKFECLNECLNRLSAEEKQIFVDYYAREGEKKSEARRKIAERLMCEMNALHVRIFRLRGVLAKCIEACMKNKL